MHVFSKAMDYWLQHDVSKISQNILARNEGGQWIPTGEAILCFMQKQFRRKPLHPHISCTMYSGLLLLGDVRLSIAL